ncbi:hypothetical protein, partial [Klebsiella pneumoniae]|uniref:hypothetical protein n=1 Tax=Klebsiella pneumoniae TaxID=573 RepID=UPI003B5CB07E
KACVLPENPASYRVVRTKSYLFNKAVQQLHQSLLASGLKSKLSVYTGGHDYAWWRGAIIDGLSDV